jgi:uncharacterized membrane protein YgcG
MVSPRPLLFTLFATLATIFAVPAKAQVIDEAQLFSDEARREATETIQQVRDKTSPSKTIIVQTVPNVSGDVREYAENLFRDHRVNGVQILITAEPRRLVITSGEQTQAGFRNADAVRNAMLDQFRAGRYDDGLRTGVSLTARELMSAFPAGAKRYGAGNERSSRLAPAPDSAPLVASHPSSSGLGGFGTIILIALGLLAFFLFGRRATSGPAYGSPTGPYAGRSMGGREYQAGGPGFGPMGRSGWGSGLLSGLGGAFMGNWLYDRFRGGPGPANASQTPEEPRAMSDATGSDDGNVGGSSVGDWEDPGSTSDGGNDW